MGLLRFMVRTVFFCTAPLDHRLPQQAAAAPAQKFLGLVNPHSLQQLEDRQSPLLMLFIHVNRPPDVILSTQKAAPTRERPFCVWALHLDLQFNQKLTHILTDEAGHLLQSLPTLHNEGSIDNGHDFHLLLQKNFEQPLTDEVHSSTSASSASTSARRWAGTSSMVLTSFLMRSA
nr:MAG TPA: hypothetical protein [Caudoviricetes sp.]